jgi:hypothetical protein
LTYEDAVASPEFQSQTTSLPFEPPDAESGAEALPQPAKTTVPATRIAAHSVRCFIALPHSPEVAGCPAVEVEEERNSYDVCNSYDV